MNGALVPTPPSRRSADPALCDLPPRTAASAVPHFHAIRDRHGRIMVAMTRNTDIADAFEQEGADPEFFALFGAPGYSLGIDIILYAMTR
jgi:hypothetical protein